MGASSSSFIKGNRILRTAYIQAPYYYYLLGICCQELCQWSPKGGPAHIIGVVRDVLVTLQNRGDLLDKLMMRDRGTIRGIED